MLDRDHNATCATCHTGEGQTNNDFTRYTCFGCHQHTPANIRAEHAEEGTRNVDDCVRCHVSVDGEGGERGRGERGAMMTDGPNRHTPSSWILSDNHSAQRKCPLGRRPERVETMSDAPTINRGDIFWIAPDDSRGPAPSYSHPHVVVQDDVFNHSRISTVVVCALTTNLSKATEPGNVLLEPGEGDLPKRSVVVVSQVSSVEKTRLGHRIGVLSDARVDEVVACLRFLQRAFLTR